LAAQGAPERIGEAVPRLRTAERRQVEWRPVSLEELVPDDHRVRAVWRFVEGLDLSALLSPIKSLEGRPGHPAADPRILLALWLFATIEGVASARQVARLCGEHISYRWLCGGVGMNAKTLADFRVGHGAALEHLLINSFAGLVIAGVASLDRVAQDGVRVRASAGAASFRRHSSLEDCREEAAQAVRRLQEETSGTVRGIHRLRIHLGWDVPYPGEDGCAAGYQVESTASRRLQTEDRDRPTHALHYFCHLR
jgi:transposase